MKKLRNDQSGFSALEVILILVIVAVLGGVGYYVYSQRNMKSNSETTNTSSGVAKDSANTNTSNGYLKITEMGVKLKLPSDQTDLYYFYGLPSDGGEDKVASLSTRSLEKLSTECAAEKNWTARVEVTNTPDAAYPGNPSDSNESYRNFFPDGVTIDGNFYYLVFTNGPCSTDEKVSDAQVALKQSLKTIKIEKL
jgi:Tfp pilus assembly protein PilE